MAELVAALTSVKKATSPGPDNITYTALSHLGENGKKCLLGIFNRSWEAGRLEQKWKHGRIVAALKPGKIPTSIESYRHIALLRCVGKLMEKMVLHRLDWDLTTRNAYPPQVSGFRKGRSSIDNALALANSIKQAKTQRNITIAVFLDIKSAYDCVYHEAIRSAMKSSGLGGRMYAWISDYLTDRCIYMSADSGDTPLYRVTRGVPQGGVLSPTLFNITMMGIEKCLPQSVEISLYADDICIWSAGRNRRVLRARLQRAINSIAAFLGTRGLDISASKCAAIAFTKRDVSNYGLTIAGCTIPYVPHHKFLGVTFDKSLTWSKHVRYIKDKLASFVNIFRMLSSNAGGCNVQSLLRLYDVMCVGLLRYSLPVLLPLSKGNARALQSMQAQVLRVCIGVPKTISTVASMVECRRLAPLALGTQEVLRAQLRFAARQQGHPLALSSATEVRDLLPLHFQHPSPSLQPPWMYPRLQITTGVPGITRKQDIATPALTFFALGLLFQKYRAHTHLYTDGSVTASSSAIGIWFPSSCTAFSATLSHRTTSMVTELAALRAAFAYIIEQPARQWAIFTDSRAALQCLKSYPKEQLVLDIHALHLQALNAHHHVELQWIPAHCGIT